MTFLKNSLISFTITKVMDVSIIIVNYNTRDYLKNCIESILKYTKNIDFEIIVSDNGSTDGSLEMIKSDFPQVILIENNENLGFGKANNRGLKVAKGKYIFYLNSDTVLLNNAVKIFFDYFEENGQTQKIGGLGTNLLNPDMTTGFSYGEIFGGNCKSFSDIKKDVFLYALRTWNKFFKSLFGYKLKKIQNNPVCEKKIGKVGHILGADLFVKNDENAFFDENFFMYMEETDLEYQMSKKDFSMFLIEGPQIIHFGGAASNNIEYEVLDTAKFSRINYFISRVYFCKKNFSKGFGLFFIKFFTLITWLNPLVFSKTKKYIGKMLKI